MLLLLTQFVFGAIFWGVRAYGRRHVLLEKPGGHDPHVDLVQLDTVRVLLLLLHFRGFCLRARFSLRRRCGPT